MTKEIISVRMNLLIILGLSDIYTVGLIHFVTEKILSSDEAVLVQWYIIS